jgi:FkbM family methyltransferase
MSAVAKVLSTCVKVGANDGITGDPCGDVFLANKRWRGLLIEPIPYCVGKLRKVYSDDSRFIIEPVAIGHPGTATIFYVANEAQSELGNLPVWYDQIGGLSREHILRHLTPSIAPYIRTLEVAVEELTKILQRNHVSRIDFLHIDTEGHDLQVLRSLDFNVLKPGTIFIEHKHLSNVDRRQLKALLTHQGYRIRNAGADYFATLKRP